MPRSYLHPRHGSDELLDPENREPVDMDAVRQTVLTEARGIISGDLKASGGIDQRYRIDAENGEGEVVHSLPFMEALSMVHE